MNRDDRRPMSHVERVQADARQQMREDGCIHCHTAVELLDLGIDPDEYADEIAHEEESE